MVMARGEKVREEVMVMRRREEGKRMKVEEYVK